MLAKQVPDHTDLQHALNILHFLMLATHPSTSFVTDKLAS